MFKYLMNTFKNLQQWLDEVPGRSKSHFLESLIVSRETIVSFCRLRYTRLAAGAKSSSFWLETRLTASLSCLAPRPKAGRAERE